MPNIKNRVQLLEQHSAASLVKPCIFIVGDNEIEARADWEAKNGQPIPDGAHIVHFTVIKPTEGKHHAQ